MTAEIIIELGIISISQYGRKMYQYACLTIVCLVKYRAIITAYDTFDRQSYLHHWMFCFMLLNNSSLWHLVLLLTFVSHINS